MSDHLPNDIMATRRWLQCVHVVCTVMLRFGDPGFVHAFYVLQYSAMDDSGLSIAIAGRTGLAHYSLLKRRWILFGNEAQEKNMVVCGGLIWWRSFICVGCFDLVTGKDQVCAWHAYVMYSVDGPHNAIQHK